MIRPFAPAVDRTPLLVEARPRLAALAAIATLGSCATPAREPADLVFLNGTVYPGPTYDATRPTAEALAVRGDTIVFIGSSAEARRYGGPAARVIDLEGAFVYPGWIDAHADLEGLGRRLDGLELSAAESQGAVLAGVARAAARREAGAWILGAGLDETHWASGGERWRLTLDSVAPGHPVLLLRSDGAGAVANGSAIAAAGLVSDEPSGPCLAVDEAGEPTGILDPAAVRLALERLPRPSEVERDSLVARGARRMVELGWTQVHDRGGTWADVDRLRRLYESGALSLRVYKPIAAPSADADSLLAAGPGERELGNRLVVRALDLQLDGPLGSRRAALLEPYADLRSARGALALSPRAIPPILLAALRRGVQVRLHATGDSAVRAAFALVKEAQQQFPLPDHDYFYRRRWRIEGIGRIDPTDLIRFGQRGLMPSVQPAAGTRDLLVGPERLGAARMQGVQPWRTLIELGVPVAGGTGTPLVEPDLRASYLAAVTRRDSRGYAGPDSLWHPEEALRREEALALFTWFAAWAAFQDDERGLLGVGRWADLTILSVDLLNAPESEIARAKILMTVVGGTVVHDARTGS
ncbi:MAG: amidohydrolase [Gemmatimonadales bacterium]